ncbi:hypothetical protein [Dethiosulfatibacter aminovorans]|uniref:hypothetical protein n=1 Tax=Dethiosulfatibacter aminovorans TaxID=332095 RepID=UPI000934873C|nr:hypothetical protein [Dethiosulfatibacter aminovorans]
MPRRSGGNKSKQTNGDGKSCGIMVLGFLFPLVGLILYFAWKNSYPLKARSAGIGAVAGFIIHSLVFYALLLLSI